MESAGESASDAPPSSEVGPMEEADMREYGQSLGVDIDIEPDLLWVVQEAFNAPLPASWTEHTDDEGRVYFFHEATSQSTWHHPMDAVYRELLGLIKQVRMDMRTAGEAHLVEVVQHHLREVHQRALKGLEGWSGPYNSEAGEYYYNAELKVSTWESPLAEWEHELSIRHAVLCRCLLPAHMALGGDGSTSGLGTTASGPDLLQALKLPLNLIKRDTSDRPPDTPTSNRSFHTARSAASTRSQQHSGRSAEKLSREARKTSLGYVEEKQDQAVDEDYTFGSTNAVHMPSLEPK
mmetsp:Transcript_2653/g.4917  ORF Transcript_2653/g.4917 Transcript_2653/m.4917 type:complete len:293 (-) Transcript_2653:53-931(-)